MLVWIGFLVLVTLFLALDLGVFNKNAHVISVKEASIWTAIWVTLALLFSFVVHWVYAEGYVANPTNITPNDASLKYITGYLIEKSLSIDNIFVIAVIFKSFKIPMIYQHRVLFWGVFGAIIFRAIMIFFGVLLINKFSFMTYIFGAFLLFTAFKMLRKQEEEEEFNPKKSWIYRNIRKVIPITSQIDKERFWVRKKNLLVATPLFVALIVIEIMDVLFAIDSVPAILAITADPFLVFTSNIFAILGLRSMYFFLSNMLKKFQYLEYSLIAILTFVGIKMLFVHYYKLPEWASLGFISLALIIGIWISIKKMNEVKEE
jgi:tellurite resistance protein TerC